jgi:hypothetical protein
VQATAGISACVLVMIVTLLILKRKAPIYIINFSAYKPAKGCVLDPHHSSAVDPH